MMRGDKRNIPLHWSSYSCPSSSPDWGLFQCLIKGKGHIRVEVDFINQLFSSHQSLWCLYMVMWIYKFSSHPTLGQVPRAKNVDFCSSLITITKLLLLLIIFSVLLCLLSILQYEKTNKEFPVMRGKSPHSRDNKVGKPFYF